MCRTARIACFGWVAIVVVAACGQDSNATSVMVRDSAGVEIVESAFPAWTETTRWQLSPDPMLTIDQPNAGPEYEFHEISAAVRLSDGRIVVADGGFEHALRFFDPQGVLIRSTGGRGAGPDEFRRIDHIQVLPDDTLLVSDGLLRRATYLNTDGERIGELLYGRPGSATPAGLWRRSDGHWVGVVAAFPPMDGPPSAGIHRTEATLVSLSPDGVGVDTLGTFPGGDVAFIDMGNGRIVQGIVPFGHAFAFAVADNGIYIGTGDRLSFDLISSDGQRLRSTRAPENDLTFTDQDFDAFRAASMAALPNEDARAMLDQYLSNIPRPGEKSAYIRILVDSEGTVWLGPYETPFQAHGPWHIFASSGAYLGELPVPERLHVLDVGPDYVLGQWRDDLGVESIRMYRIGRG